VRGGSVRCGSVEPPPGGHAQDRHPPSGGRRLRCGLLLCRCPCPAQPCPAQPCPALPCPAQPRYQTRDRQRRGPQGLPHPAEGDAVEHPRHYRRGGKKPAKAQRRVARRQQGRQRRRKAVGHLPRAQQTVQRQRTDFHHQTAPARLRRDDTISRAAGRGANLVRNAHRAKSSSEAGWAAFRTILEATAACAGRRVVAVPPAFTSQDWRGCGERACPSRSRCAPRSAHQVAWSWTAMSMRPRLCNGPGRPFGDARHTLRG
jgi:hypothetical protein